MRGWEVAAWWLLTRLLACGIFLGRELTRLPLDGWDDTLVEYPLPAALLLCLPWLLAHVLVFPRSFLVILGVTALALDACFTGALVRRRVHWAATAAWLIGVPLLGAVSYFRFDLLPAVLVGFAVLTLGARPQLAQ